ncbi:MAG: ABC transporter ATP-binding protein [Alphaproteobacteria bacterium]|mgnify:FL=1|jgi:NitT/TauT family transport system ATP-binding protein|nr:ABC transporter ATP-binding protein [Alphaproteobacteria bacterium]MDP6238222.1 ABC transporter ATP-binding protein [Alphaproteobacteria bacterium]MDP7173946.1 ABC transporter ATP-binding protein [Alphaproteobacteria bacterium]MDP7233355.1 ABC transporter ATP-binding protein [Alphaproteobacteria bacterium]|tara:strand:- start:1019 stop:1864 length:846 start_codon:yes stop_codon:yes gene_type:complete
MTAAGSQLSVRIDRKAYPSMTTDEPDRLAIEGLSFDAAAGEFICIVGPSGCGKTTMLNVVAGLDHTAQAAIEFGGKSDAKTSRISYMFQTPRLLPWATVRENVSLVLPPQEADRGRAEALLEEMKLGDRLDEYPNRLSGGMQRRVALARAFVTEPELLLLDEPFISLDGPVADHLRGILLQLWRAQPTTVLFVTHDLREAIYLADRILFLSDAPSRVILDEPVPIKRPRDVEDPRIENYRQQLLAGNRLILQGLNSVSNSPALALGNKEQPGDRHVREEPR